MAKAKPTPTKKPDTVRPEPVEGQSAATSDTVHPEPVEGQSADTGETQAFNALRITAAREGFRRAGRAWSKEAIEIKMDDLSDDDIAALKAEPMLTVEEVTLP